MQIKNRLLNPNSRMTFNIYACKFINIKSYNNQEKLKVISYYLKIFTLCSLFMNEIGGTNRDNNFFQDFWQSVHIEGELATAILKKSSLKQRLNFHQMQNFKKRPMLY